jgi:hypothetical protein
VRVRIIFKKRFVRTSGTVSIKNSRNADVNSILTLKSVSQGFGDTLTLVITSTRADRINMAPTFDSNQLLNGEKSEKKLTIPRVEGGPQDLHTPLIQMSIKFSY